MVKEQGDACLGPGEPGAGAGLPGRALRKGLEIGVLHPSLPIRNSALNRSSSRTLEVQFYHLLDYPIPVSVPGSATQLESRISRAR